MKNTCLLILLISTLQLFAQPALKYQLRLNMIPVKSFAFAGAARIGLETVNRKYNRGMDLMSFWVDAQSSIVYTRDSFFRRSTTNTGITARGLAFNIFRSYEFKNNNNRWIFGAQFFTGISRQVSTIYREVFDTTSNKYSGPHWVSAHFNQLTEYQKHGPKLYLAASIFARLQLEINRRFTFTPELQFPVTIYNAIGGNTVLDLLPGFNFCLGYRFGKELI